MVYASHSFKTRLFFSLFSQDHTSAIRHTLEKDEWKIITREICCATMNNKTSTDTLSAKKKHKKKHILLGIFIASRRFQVRGGADLSFLFSPLPPCQPPAGWKWFQSESWHPQQSPPCALNPPSHGSLSESSSSVSSSDRFHMQTAQRTNRFIAMLPKSKSRKTMKD